MKYIDTLKANSDEYKQQLEEKKALHKDQVNMKMKMNENVFLGVQFS